MALDRNRTLRGALAGAIAAGVWALQQPADKRVFGVDYSDVELLGRAVTREHWLPAGTAMHLANGAVFGAVYSAVAPSLPGKGWQKGLAAGMAEHLATWPSTSLVDRFHPRSEHIPTLWGDHRAFAQAVWRHALFGALLGDIERRLNP